MTLGERIRTTREEKGLTLSGLAKRSGVSKAYLSQLENEVSKDPSVWIVLKIAEALEVPLSYLVESKPIEMRCEECVFFDNTGISKLRGYCRRYPPQVYYDPRVTDWDFKVTASQPSVHIENWCGEWKPKG